MEIQGNIREARGEAAPLGKNDETWQEFKALHSFTPTNERSMKAASAGKGTAVVKEQSLEQLKAAAAAMVAPYDAQGKNAGILTRAEKSLELARAKVTEAEKHLAEVYDMQRKLHSRIHSIENAEAIAKAAALESHTAKSAELAASEKALAKVPAAFKAMAEAAVESLRAEVKAMAEAAGLFINVDNTAAVE